MTVVHFAKDGGVAAHIQTTLQHRQPGILGQAPQVQTAVLVPVCEHEGEAAILFTRRALTLRRQPGEISFPGGHSEPADPDVLATAIREASEELGVIQSAIQPLGPLDTLVAWSGLIVYPFVGVIPTVGELHPVKDEVEEVFTVSLERLLALSPQVYDVPLKPLPPEDFPFDRIPHGRNYEWRSGSVRQWFYEVDGRVIWGLTARILSHFLEVMQSG